MLKQLLVENWGQIEKADIALGGLTVLVGPQASGKSILLQCIRLVADIGYVLYRLKEHGLDWDGEVARFFDVYLGEGMGGIMKPGSTRIEADGEELDLPRLVARQKRNKDTHCFYIPAQRVLALRDGWPRSFRDYSPGDPFAVREFSDRLLRLMEGGLREVFPGKKAFKKPIRDALVREIMPGFRLQVDKPGLQKRLVLHQEVSSDDSAALPHMVWSAGQ